MQKTVDSISHKSRNAEDKLSNFSSNFQKLAERAA